MPTVTIEQIKAARHPTCVWTEDDMVSAIERRFPRQDAIELRALVQAWADDPELADGTLLQCVLLSRRLLRPAGLSLRLAGGIQLVSDPRAQLKQLSDAMDAMATEAATQPSA